MAMQMMKIDIISRETIKPSSPTPQHLRNFRLSFIDQTAPAMYVPLLLFYLSENASDCTVVEVAAKRSQHLKASLSKLLAEFYPLAGIIRDRTTIECNDNGAEYIEARVRGALADILKQPDASLVRSFFPIECESTDAETGRIVFVQASFFECGGMALGLCFSHKITDGATLSTVVKRWSSIALSKSQNTVKFPEFNAASFFHPLDSEIPPSMKLIRDESVITKRYVIESSKIAQLKAKAASPMVVQPTRVEVVAALIWKCLINVSTSTKGFPRLTVMSNAVNLRKRTEPSLAENCVGNVVGMFFASNSTEKETDLQGLVTELRKELKKICKNAMETINEKKKAWLGMCRIDNFGIRDDVDHFICTSWCRFGFYEADFGWGKPVWVTVPNVMIPNLVVLMDTKDGEGVEAFVILNKEEMGLFELEKELLEFATVNPNVLN